MQSRSRCPKGSKTRLRAQTLVRLCPVTVKESPGITSTRSRTGKQSKENCCPENCSKNLKKYESGRKEDVVVYLRLSVCLYLRE